MKKIKAAETLFKIKEHNKLKNWQTNESGETMKIKIKTFFNLLIVLSYKIFKLGIKND